ncbi:serine hydrolase domain-containing protein [Steroidobacter sp.]|uniref:serine hydrolase domain-containing protein n=1 Tax=Steroidobacter sp. TaxID=1978227 RepID=UPI001A52C088|nr:serine hydrolase domain-containing protein [Steroidobacter sp.]MBL8266267.1 beta-lactamase family protein [Steroidobacter sp.]
MSLNRRQVLMQAGLLAGATAVGRFAVADSTGAPKSAADEKLFTRLDEFVKQYMAEMHSPGMTLVLADRSGVRRVANYGLGDLERRVPVGADELFEIGSISKSFIAICLLQLHDEGKLDLRKPVAEYIPWFRIESKFAAITTHDLLTHGSGLPGNAPMLPSDPTQRHRAAYAPGAHFHYCNLGYNALGELAVSLDGRDLPELFRKRIFEPLGMSQSEPVITLDIRNKLVKNYSAFQNDSPNTRDARLAEAAGIIFTGAAGCIASTAKDMGAYIRMIANGGEGPARRLLSKEAFALFSKAHIEAKEFGPTASYGYGIAVDTLDGNTVVRHTGGMVSFMSSLLVDIKDGFGAFASVNAQQGYRPTPVTQFAVQLMRAQKSNKALPAIPAANPALRVTNAADYAGTYTEAGGKRLVVEASGDKLFVTRANGRFPLQPAGAPDAFVIADGGASHFPLAFARANEKDPKSAVVEASLGGEWYTTAAYSGPKKFDTPKEWQAYVGHYRNENPWIGSTRVVLRKGKLWLDGTTPLELNGDRFSLRDEPHSPEWIQFGEIVNGRCQRLKFSGEDLWRQAAV